MADTLRTARWERPVILSRPPVNDKPASSAQHPSYLEASAIAGAVSDSRLRDLVRYWQSIHPRTHLPGRQHFDPLDIPKLLPLVTLTDVERDPFRVRYRVLGSEIARAQKRDFTGKYADEVFPDRKNATIFECRRKAMETCLPVHHFGQANVEHGYDFVNFEGVYLPLAGDGAMVDMILSMFIYTGSRDKWGDNAF